MELKSHDGDGIRYAVHLSAPKGGLAQMIRDPQGSWVAWEDYAKLQACLTDLKAEADKLKAEPDALTAYLYAAELGKKEIKRLKAECQSRQAENSVLAVECDSLKAEVERLRFAEDLLKDENKHFREEEPLPDGWNSSVAKACDLIAEKDKEIARLKAEVERLTSDIQMEKENEDRLVREWQRANNEVYGLKTQVAALIDDQTSLKAEVERLTKAGDAMANALWPSIPQAVYEVSDWEKAKEGDKP